MTEATTEAHAVADVVYALLVRATCVAAPRFLGLCLTDKSRKDMEAAVDSLPAGLPDLSEAAASLHSLCSSFASSASPEVANGSQGVLIGVQKSQLTKRDSYNFQASSRRATRAVEHICAAARFLGDTSPNERLDPADVITKVFEPLVRATVLIPIDVFPQLWVWAAEAALLCDDRAVGATGAVDFLLDSLTVFEELPPNVEFGDRDRVSEFQLESTAANDWFVRVRPLAYKDHQVRAYLSVSVLLRSAAARATSLERKSRLVQEGRAFAKAAVVMRMDAPHAWSVLGNAWNYIFTAGDPENGYITHGSEAFRKALQAYGRALTLWGQLDTISGDLDTVELKRSRSLDPLLVEARREMADCLLNRASARLYEAQLAGALEDLTSAAQTYAEISRDGTARNSRLSSEALDGYKQSMMLKSAVLKTVRTFQHSLAETEVLSPRAIEFAVRPLKANNPASCGHKLTLTDLDKKIEHQEPRDAVLAIRVLSSVDQVVSICEAVYVVIDADSRLTVCITYNSASMCPQTFGVGDLLYVPVALKGGVYVRNEHLQVEGKGQLKIVLLFIDFAICRSVTVVKSPPCNVDTAMIARRP